MIDILNAVKIARDAMEDKKGTDVKVLNISGLSPISDYFVIGSGNNVNQVKAMADEVIDKLSKAGIDARHTEGYNNANWILLDYGDFIVHVFTNESRDFYNIERIWRDAKVE